MKKRTSLALGLVASSISALAENGNIPPPKQNQPAQIEGVVTFQAGNNRGSFSAGSDGVKGVVDTSIGSASIKSDGTARGTEISGTAKLGKFEKGAGCSADGSTCTTTDKRDFGLKEETTERKYSDGKGNPISQREYEAAVKKDLLSPEVAPVKESQACTKWSGDVPAGRLGSVGGSTTSCTESVAVSAPMDKFCRENPADSQCSSAVPPSTRISSESVEVKGTLGGGYQGAEQEAKAEVELSHTTTNTFKSPIPGGEAHKEAYFDKKDYCLSVLASGQAKSECLQSPMSDIYRAEQEAITVKVTGGAKVKDVGAETSLQVTKRLDEKIFTAPEEALEEFDAASRAASMMEQHAKEGMIQNRVLEEGLGPTVKINSRIRAFNEKKEANAQAARERAAQAAQQRAASEAAQQSAAYAQQQQLQFQQFLQQITPAVTPRSTNQPRSQSPNNAAPATGTRSSEPRPSTSGSYCTGCSNCRGVANV